ncbi:MAG: hypothetical protein COB84_08455, partial [Rhodobacteraceae bacterium]
VQAELRGSEILTATLDAFYIANLEWEEFCLSGSEPSPRSSVIMNLFSATKIQIPPAPQITTPNKPDIADKTTDEEAPLVVPTSAAFASIRNKDLIAPVRHGSKDSSPKTPPVIPAPRISIELPKNTAQAAQTNAFKMPQGRTQTFEYKKIFSPRLIMAVFALLLVAGVYFAYGYIFDGKDEIAKLEATPETQVQTASVPTDLTPPADNAAETTALNSLAKTQSTPTTPPSIAPLATPPVADSAPSFSSAPLVTAPPVTPSVTPSVIIAEVPNPPVQSPPTQNQVAVAPTVTTPALPQAPSLAQTPATPEVLSQQPEPAAALEVTPSTKGTLSPDGIMLYAGAPKIIPPLRKLDVQEIIAQTPDLLAGIKPEIRTQDLEELQKKAALAPTDQPATDAQETAVIQAAPEPAQPDLLALADPALANIRPKLRPSNLAIITTPKPTLLDHADPALAGIKPRVRPKNLKIIKPEPIVDTTAIEKAVEQAAKEQAAKAQQDARKKTTAYAPSRTTKRPKVRPRNFASKVSRSKKAAIASIKSEQKQTAALTPKSARGTAKASLPSAVNVQKQATERSTFSKKRLSLVGVYGKASNRRALVRLPSGRYVKVKTGQRVSGWKVSAIGESSVRMRKGSRDQVLRMPR